MALLNFTVSEWLDIFRLVVAIFQLIVGLWLAHKNKKK